MKLLINTKLLLLLLLFQGALYSADDYLFSKGRYIYDHLCMTCHVFSSVTEVEKMGPPIDNIARRYSMRLSGEEELYQYLKDFLALPTAEKSLMPAQVLTKFEIKEAIILSDQELRAISHWMGELKNITSLDSNLAVTMTELADGKFRFDLPNAEKAGWELYDNTGNKILKLENNDGEAFISFDGTDESNSPLANGSYEYYVEQNDLDVMGFINIISPATNVDSTFLIIGQLTYMTSCKICHTLEEPASFVAPSFSAIIGYYKQASATDQEGINLMVDFLQLPSPDKSLLPAEERAKYNEMALIASTEDKNRAVSTWIWQQFSGNSIEPFGSMENYQVPKPIYASSGSVTFNLPELTTAELFIYNHLGELVTMYKNNSPAHKIIWDPGNNSPGSYLYRLKYGSETVNGVVYIRQVL